MTRRQLRYRRRNRWTRDDVIIAYDACPKQNQAYGPGAPFVREVADLVGRTPAAVSRTFGNLWAARTRGVHGLTHASHLIEEVVGDYGDDFDRLRQDALRLRLLRVPRTLTPRIEVHSETGVSLVTEEEFEQIARRTGLRSEDVFATSREGSLTFDGGFVLDGLLIGVTAWLALTESVRLVRDLLRERRQPIREPIRVTRSRTWQHLESGEVREVEREVFDFYLPGFPVSGLSADDRARMVGFLNFIRGVRPEQTARNRARALSSAIGPMRGRPLGRASLERILGVQLTGASNASVKQLSDLVKAARTAGFRRALTATRRRRR